MSNISLRIILILGIVVGLISYRSEILHFVRPTLLQISTIPENDELNVIKEKQIDLIGSESTETLRLLSYPKKENVTPLYKLELINGDFKTYSSSFTDNDGLDFEDTHVVSFGNTKTLVVDGLNVGAHGSSMRFFSSDLEPICSGYKHNECEFTSDRMSEPLIEDLNGDNVPEVIELNVGEDGGVNVQVYQFTSNKVIDISTEGSGYSLSLITPPSREYSEILERYPSLK